MHSFNGSVITYLYLLGCRILLVPISEPIAEISGVTLLLHGVCVCYFRGSKNSPLSLFNGPLPLSGALRIAL